ncbi:MAG: hypothetical protein PHR39_06490 [Actinomycetota bacterium]|nr:hypothetical protein [Actinomycetota bacterium]
MYIFVVGIPSLIRAIIWNKCKLDDRRYYEGYPENWAEKLGGLK